MRSTRRSAPRSRDSRAVARLPVLSTLLGGHVVWLAVAALGTALFGVLSCRRRAVDARVVPFALPLVYALSYVPVWTSGDFRYLYPSTLVLQSVTWTWTAVLAGRAAALAIPHHARGDG